MNRLEKGLRDWPTTVAAVVSAIAGFVLFAPEHFNSWPIVQDAAAYIFAGGLAAFGIAASSVTRDKER